MDDRPLRGNDIHYQDLNLDGRPLQPVTHSLPDPRRRLVVIAPYDGIGGAMRSLELLGICPAVYIAIELDAACRDVVHAEWPHAVQHVVSMAEATEDKIRSLIRPHWDYLRHGLVIGGPPCQGLSGLSRMRKGFDDPRSDGVGHFIDLASRVCTSWYPDIEWHVLLENVASMNESD